MAAMMGMDQNDLFAIIRATGAMGAGGGGGGGGFGGVPVAEPGDYLVSMTVDGQTHRQTLRVERTVGGGGSGLPFELEDMIKQYERWVRYQR